eukprot:6514157-Pyramimonas_sp.AAC.1
MASLRRLRCAQSHLQHHPPPVPFRNYAAPGHANKNVADKPRPHAANLPKAPGDSLAGPAGP